MKCQCGAEIAADSANCLICGARKPFAWTCEKCEQDVPWDHAIQLVCSTVCPKCGAPKPPSLPSPVINRPIAVIPNCSGFGQFVLLVGAIASLLGCIYTVVVAVGTALGNQWAVSLIVCPIGFLLQAGDVRRVYSSAVARPGALRPQIEVACVACLGVVAGCIGWAGSTICAVSEDLVASHDYYLIIGLMYPSARTSTGIAVETLPKKFGYCPPDRYDWNI